MSETKNVYERHLVMIRNLEAIHMTKRNVVEEICKIAASSGIVNRMFVFGSAVTDRCIKDSDIDICINTDYDDKNMKLYDLYSEISKVCDYNCDILTYNKLGNSLKDEVDKNGIVVYEIEDEKD